MVREYYDLAGTNLWRDHDGAEGARLIKLNLSGKRTEYEYMFNTCFKGSGLIVDLIFNFIQEDVLRQLRGFPLKHPKGGSKYA